ncbi:MAG: GNAT family N-acetyltransferase [Candidatus Marsarchaeota archaeon]|nr:GNAT family N-acetyltransferase [Candidatus Marsarchaeota archaeon]
MPFKDIKEKRCANKMILRSNSLSVFLSDISIDDADAIAKSANSLDISHNFGSIESFPFPYTRKDAVALIESATIGYATNSAYHLAIKDIETKELLGMITLYDLDNNNKHCELGYWIGKEHRNRGYASAGILLGLHFGFEILSLNKISSKVLDFNNVSIHILEKLGFEKEGTLIENYYIKNLRYDENGILASQQNGSFVNQHMYAIFKKNYLKINAQSN